MRSALNHKGDLYPAFPLGGTIRILTVNAATWTELDPQGADLVYIQTPPISGGRVVHTNTSTFSDLEDGAEVTPLHLQRAVDLYPGQQEFCVDRDRENPSRLFFAIADVADTDADLLWMWAAD